MRPCQLSLGRFSLFVAIALSFGLAGIAQEAQVSSPVASRIVNRIDDSHLTTLKGSIHPLANARNDRGAAPESMQLERMHLVLKRSDTQETALRQLIGDMHTPGTASYHKWLTPDQFGKQFGPSDQDITSVETWLTQHGFSVSKVNPGKQTIEFTGNVAQLRSAFHTQIHKYEVNGEAHYANAGNPQIPEALAPVIGGFVSLNNFRARSYAKSPGKATYDPRTDKAQPQWTVATGNGNNYVLSPADYAVQYNLQPLYNAGTTGAGQTIAVVNETNVNIGLVNQFRSLFNLPFNPPQVIIDGNDPGIDGINNPDGPNFASIEAYLDVEWAGAVAPGATVDLVIAADTQLESGLFLAAEHAVYGNVAPIVSLSFGACEATIGSTNAFLNNLWEQAAAQGITVLVSTGDSGSAGCDNDNTQEYAVEGQAVSGFASTPYNVAVGGTDFYYSGFSGGVAGINAQLPTYWNETSSNSTPGASIKGVIPEQPWNESQYGLTLSALFAGSSPSSTSIAGGSGGASALYSKPSWQKGAGVPADSARDIPDVSLFASSGANDSYYPECYEDGDCQPASSGGTVQITGVGGTSASTPAFAGIMALVNQKYGRQGQANFVLYPLATQFPAAFHDVTAGTNSVPCDLGSVDCIAVTNPVTVTDPNLGTAVEGQIGTGTTAEYNAGAGYDLATGLGTVDANALVSNWNKVTFASTTTTLTPSKTSFAHGSSITISGSVTAASGTPTGDVALVASTTEPVQQGQTTFALSGGSYSGSNTTLPGGTYNIWGQYSGDGVNAASSSTPAQITVTPEASGIFFNIFDNAVGNLVTSGTGNIPYGSQFVLDALTAPSSQLSAFENCELNNTTCPVFTTPTGTVTFSDGSTVLNTAVVNAEGDAEYTPPAAFSVGQHSITASYSGDKSYNPGSATAITFTIVANPPTVYITSPKPTYTKGQTSTLTVLVESFVNGTAPAGTVTISGAPSGTPTTATLSAGVDPVFGVTVGLATVAIPATAATGTYNITATYTPSGTTNYTGSATAAPYPLQITAASGIATTTTATASPTATSPTAAVVVAGTVVAASGSAPTGTVTLYLAGLDGNTGGNDALELPLGSVSLTAGSGSTSSFGFSITSQSLVQGANQLILQYSGNSTDAASAAFVTIANPLSDFSLVPNTTLLPLGVGSGAASGTIPITLTSNSGFAGTVNLTCTAATGVTCSIPASESLSSGASTTATLTVNAPAGTANLSYNVLVTGTDSTGKYVHTVGVQAVVNGSASGSSSFALTANPTTLNLTAGAATGNTSTITVAPEGAFTATVNLACTVASPSGATSPATCALAAPSVASATGTDVLTVTTTSTTTAGAYTVTVTGTSGSITQTATVTVNVTSTVAGTFALSNSGGITVAPGATTGNTSTITITPANGFASAVNFTCSIAPTAASDPATCSIPATVNVSGVTTATLSVSTTAATSALNRSKSLFWPTAGGTVLALVVFFGIPARKRNWSALLGLFVLFVSIGAIGCGGGSGGGGGGGGGGGTGNPGTSAGTYTVTVTGTSGTITQTTTVTLTVN